MRSRHWLPERNFEVIAGKVIGADGARHRFAFARTGGSAEQFAGALTRAGVCDLTPATVLSDGDTGLRNLQAQVLPDATVVLDWFRIAMRFEHVLKTATSVGARVAEIRRNDVERAKWRLWHGRWRGCLIKLASIHRRTEAERIRNAEGIAAILLAALSGFLANPKVSFRAVTGACGESARLSAERWFSGLPSYSQALLS